MKTGNMIVAIVLVALCLIGWLSFGHNVISQASDYEQYVAQGDSWVEEGLYQRAIGQYEMALEQKSTEELLSKMHNAYQLRYAEAPEETLEAYMDFLQSAVNAFPANKNFVDSYVQIYCAEEAYEDAYTCLSKAIEKGYNTDEVKAMQRKVRYVYDVGRTSYYMLTQSEGNTYATHRKDGHNAYGIELGYILTRTYDYVGLPSADGIVVVTGNDSRLIDKTGLVMGIFDEKVTEAGVYADGLVPACCNGVYSYYDEFADKKFGEYEMAGKFQNGVAAVKEKGAWKLINTSGEVVCESLGEIVLDYAGCHMNSGVIIARTASNEFTIYNDEYEPVATISCTDVDICTEDGIIAVCQNRVWGFANTKGEIIIEAQYEKAKSFSNGVAAVCKDGLWGFIDKENNLVIEYQFYDVGYMGSTGACAVCVAVPETGEEAEGLELYETWKFITLKLGILEG